MVNLEGHNLGELDDQVVPEPIGLVAVDLSYLALAEAIPQLERLSMAGDADLVALVKPTFELHRPALLPQTPISPSPWPPWAAPPRPAAGASRVRARLRSPVAEAPVRPSSTHAGLDDQGPAAPGRATSCRGRLARWSGWRWWGRAEPGRRPWPPSWVGGPGFL